MVNPRIHVLFEHAWDMVPFGSAQIRLLRPLSHPGISPKIDMSSGTEYFGRSVDILIVDRLWRPDITLNLAKSIINDVRKTGAKFVYTLDDNFLVFPVKRDGWFTQEKRDIVKYWLEHADGVWVTTENLQNSVKDYCKEVVVIPNCIDERLLQDNSKAKSNKKNLTIGYMGTYTHNQDLEIVMPVILDILKRNPEINFEILGITNLLAPDLKLSNIKQIQTPSEKVEYTKFITWFASSFTWDIAIAPLQDTIFNRCKSDIKYLDYSAIGAAGIYSSLGPYISSRSIRDFQTGCIVENKKSEWQSVLELLIWNSGLREKIATNARAEMWANRIISKNIYLWEHQIELMINS